MFRALADSTRRELLDNLNVRSGQTLRELCAGLEMARQSVSKHLAVLENANLVSTVWHGREKLHYLNAVPINAIAQRWIQQYDRQRADALADLKTALEEDSMAKPQFVYTTYIRTTPEKLWQALTEPAFTSQYWGTRFDTDWQVGSTMDWTERGVTTSDPEQVVRESEPYRRLSYTWHAITPEFAASVGLASDLQARLAEEERSTVAFELEQLGEQVKLTVLHDFPAGSPLLDMVSEGWPPLLSSLKTLLETGTALPEPVPAAKTS